MAHFYVIRCRKGLYDLEIRQIVFQQFEDVCEQQDGSLSI